VQHFALTALLRVLTRSDLSASERGFLEQAHKNLEQVDTVSLIPQFKAHIIEIESTYHPDQQGKFAQLWPELSNLL
jgi:hypothetical protein